MSDPEKNWFCDGYGYGYATAFPWYGNTQTSKDPRRDGFIDEGCVYGRFDRAQGRDADPETAWTRFVRRQPPE
ncbi:hypothetical protein MTBLM5_420006 [Magnetospirillum sp. LM-5]|uniref:hypothetical protein n=1 Tax=Magnetospirillum sp. LM-5 TaxID=2681466 RepID=UPI001382DA00|nr:hypothetical protein [Magnetospirillum sp. LM-5]CAA7621967.1 hypothetical protein MTBLM5_420006 [Magnetospirillum sp. LM-5]